MDISRHLLSNRVPRQAPHAATARAPDGCCPGAPSYSCTLCAESCTSKGTCKRHIQNKHLLDYICQACGGNFVSRRALTHHFGESPTCRNAGVDIIGRSAPHFYTFMDESPVEFSSVGSCIEYIVMQSRDEGGRTNIQQIRHRILQIIQQRPEAKSALLKALTSLGYGTRRTNSWRKLIWPDNQMLDLIATLQYTVDNNPADFKSVSFWRQLFSSAVTLQGSSHGITASLASLVAPSSNVVPLQAQRDLAADSSAPTRTPGLLDAVSNLPPTYQTAPHVRKQYANGDSIMSTAGEPSRLLHGSYAQSEPEHTRELAAKPDVSQPSFTQPSYAPLPPQLDLAWQRFLAQEAPRHNHQQSDWSQQGYQL